jgi:membrane protease subunit (stomatin/prohibitin family)
MAGNYIVPNIYQDISNQGQGYFAFRFTCQLCRWSIDTTPIRSRVSTAQNVMDIGVGLLGGFWGRAAAAGEQIYGSKWHQEQAQALQKAWAEIQHEFHLCPRCHETVCMRCFHPRLNLCTRCAPDLKADAANVQHELHREAQRQQIEAGYRAPQFNTDAVPSAVEAEMVRPARAQPAALSSGGYPRQVMCPTCRRLGPPGKFCEDCGTRLPLPDLFCPQCAVQVDVSARFCPECGTKLQQAT